MELGTAPYYAACRQHDAMPLSDRAEAEGFSQPVAMSRTLYEMIGNPPNRDDPDARLGELLRMILWNDGKDGRITRQHDYLTYLSVKGRRSKYIDLTLHVIDGGLIITVKGEGEHASAYDQAHA